MSDLDLDPRLKKRDLTGRLGLEACAEGRDRAHQNARDSVQLERERSRYILREAETFFHRAGLEDTIAIHRTGVLAESFHEFETECDPIALGKHGTASEFDSDRFGKNMERVVRTSAKPCLVTPREFAPIENVLLVYDGSESCQAALDFICRTSVFDGLKLHALVTDRSACDLKAEVRLEVALTQAGFEPTIDRLPGETEAQVEQYANFHAINMMLMGSYGHNRLRELLMGNPTAELLKHSQVPVLMFP